MMLIENAFDLRDEVYLKTDSDQKCRLVTAICIRNGRITYELTLADTCSWHDDFEITKERDIVKSTCE